MPIEKTLVHSGKGRGSEFAGLLEQVRSAGLLERRPWYYAAKIASTVLALVAGVAAFAVLGDSWWQMAVAVYLAIVFAQLGFIGHDAGHGQIRQGTRANTLIGVIHANALVGLSYGWWNEKHNRHHAHPNEPGRDPDVDAGALAFTVQAAAGRRGLGRVAVRYQAWYFIPLLLLQAVSLHVNSIIWLVRERRMRRVEVLLLAAHVSGYVTALLLVLSPAKALVFAVVHQGLLGVYLGCAFAPNHKGMPAPAGSDAANFLRRQVLASRDVRPGWLVDWALGGLNYQIEHHLFPSMPRANLKRAKPLVRAYCARIGVPYRECGLFDSYRQALRHLDAMGVIGSRALDEAG
ncbi:fatty acid desaturase family protein [Actinospica robiniae]|uniref:fatty acid desaturase family protein n=1 Tax=Actinospica robiniae TaxID=304901 RepID=UPI00040E4982|nr:acyl-CoA desaturase [Actinospica robiniae]